MIYAILDEDAAAVHGKGRRTAGGWVVADDSAGTTNAAYIRQWTGSAYTAHDDPLQLGGPIVDMIRFADNDLWILFDWGLFHWDGSAYTEVVVDATYSTTFVALAGTSSTNLYIVAFGADAYHIQYWTYSGSVAGPTVVDFSPTVVAGQLYTASFASGGVLRAGGTALTRLTSGPSVEYTPSSIGTQIRRLWARTSSADWAVLRVLDGTGASVLYGSSGSWAALGSQPAYSGSEAPFHYGVHGTSDSDIWICGGLENSGVFSYLVEHWNGSTWTRHTVGTTDTHIRELLDIHADGVNDVWATGYSYDGSTSTIVAWHWDGSAWTDRSPTV